MSTSNTTQRVVEWLRGAAQGGLTAIFVIMVAGGAGIGLAALAPVAVAILPAVTALEHLLDTDSDPLTAYRVAKAGSLFGVFLTGAGIGIEFNAQLVGQLQFEYLSAGVLMIAGVVILGISAVASDLIFDPDNGIRPSPKVTESDSA